MSTFDEVEPTAAALEELRALGLGDDDIAVLSGLPYAPDILGRPHIRTVLPRVSLVSAVIGLLAGLFFTAITPYLYIIRVGGQPIVPVPPTALLLYEFIMFLLIIGTFGGFLALSRFRRGEEVHYDPRVSDGAISLVIHAPAEAEAEVIAALEAHGGDVTRAPERRQL
jgi:hypothetical protein